MRSIRLALLAVVVLVSGSAPAAGQGSDAKAIVSALTQQADAWDKAIVRKDRAAIVGNMADDFRGIDGAGTVENKTAFVDGLMDPRLTIDPYIDIYAKRNGRWQIVSVQITRLPAE